MAFDSLSDKLQNIFKNLRGKGRLSEADVKAALKEVKMALLEADVNFKVVKNFIKSVEERAIGQDVMSSLTPGQMVIKIVNEELTDRELTSNYYINEYFKLCDKIILMSLNLEEGIVMNVGKDTYVIKESFNKNRTMSEIIQKLIRVDINKLT